MSLVLSGIRGPSPKSLEISPSPDVSAFDLGPTTSYLSTDNCLHTAAGPSYLRVKSRRRGRTVQFSSTTSAALQNSRWQHDCFAAIGTEVRNSVRQHMMGWPADVRRFLAGAFAGAISKTATAPLESIRMQIMTGNKGTVMEIMRSTYERGGLLGFFSGNDADVLRTMPSKAIELASFDMYKKTLGRLRPGGSSSHPGGLATGFAGALAGLTSTLAMFPLETIRTRLAVDPKKYRNMLGAFQTIIEAEGAGALYRGLKASLLGAIPYSAVRLGSYDGLKWAYKKRTNRESVPAHMTMMFGAIAAVASSSASFPLEIVRRRAMMGTLPAGSGTLSALVMIAQREGIGALYAGVWLTWLKQAPQYAVTFLCYDLAKAWLAAENGNGKHLTDAQPGILAQQKPNAPFSLPTSR
ncbi:hypothetical protein CVIRNUC_001936 [Coccomyxa viridis]|uniref:Mitochondrial carrier protein n=1 Tax=Coccomyxa viridis TaxID=1274662 RepID=A0AAV1HX34_9CHLO|nr:hypothetical protein CVIRNUC_001936 [Coccomyxa viridis]